MKVSIITVCYNSDNYISTAIESVLSQDYPDIEYVVIDGGSTDRTVEIVSSYLDSISHFVSEPDLGIYHAMNKGIDISSGDVVGILNSDDFYTHNGVISNMVDSFSKNPGADILLFGNDFVSPDNLSRVLRRYSSYHFSTWKLFFGLAPSHPGAFVRRSAYNRIGNYKLDYPIAADFEWFVRAFLVFNLTFVSFDRVVVRMRLGGVSTSGIRSAYLGTVDVYKSLSDNNLSSYGLVLFRLPAKILSDFFKVK